MTSLKSHLNYLNHVNSPDLISVFYLKFQTRRVSDFFLKMASFFAPMCLVCRSELLFHTLMKFIHVASEKVSFFDPKCFFSWLQAFAPRSFSSHLLYTHDFFVKIQFDKFFCENEDLTIFVCTVVLDHVLRKLG